MSKNKNVEQDMIRYWRTHHSLKLFKDRKIDKFGLDVVCVTGTPLFHNKLIHFFNLYCFKRLINKVKVKKFNVLDIGCGTGRFCYYLHKLGFKVTGIDLSKERLLDNAKRMPFAKFKLMSATRLEFKNESFDLINSVVVIQHIQYPLQEKVAKEIARVLKQNGYFIMIEGTKENELIKYHYSFPRSTQGWIELFEKNGLKFVDSINGNNFFLINAYSRVKNKFKKNVLKINDLHKISGSVNPTYNYKTLKESQDKYMQHQKPIWKTILKYFDNSIICMLVVLSYPLEFLNNYLFKYYPNCEKGFIFVKE